MTTSLLTEPTEVEAYVMDTLSILDRLASRMAGRASNMANRAAAARFLCVAHVAESLMNEIVDARTVDTVATESRVRVIRRAALSAISAQNKGA